MKSGLKENWLVCRVCLKQPDDEMQDIFDKNDDKDLTLMILECGGVPIKRFDHYPDKICARCLKYLRLAYKFRITCQRSHKHLGRLIAPVTVEKSDDNDTTEYTLETEDNEYISLKLDPDDMGDLIKQELIANTDQSADGDADGDADGLDADGLDESVAETELDAEADVDAEVDDVLAGDGDAEVVDIYEPMAEDDLEAEFAEFDAIEHRAGSSMSNDVEYLEDFVVDLSTSDEEFLPETIKRSQGKSQMNKKSPATKAQRGRPPMSSSIQKATTSRGVRRTNMTRRTGLIKPGPKPKKNKEKSYICDICGNIYPMQGRLTEHIKLHKGIKPHECEICGHAFAQMQQLARHMNTHTGNRPFKCIYCPAAFADLSTRNKHHRIHTNERPYVCDVCGKSFTYTNTLKFHKMIHTGEKPHVCDICGKGFQQAYKLRNHKMTHEKRGIKLEKIEVEAIENYQEVNVATAHILEI